MELINDKHDRGIRKGKGGQEEAGTQIGGQSGGDDQSALPWQ